MFRILSYSHYYSRYLRPFYKYYSVIPFNKTSNITRNQILSLDEYKQKRPEILKHQRDLRKQRRLHIGPDASILFENFDLMWTQVHEMILIEDGGEEQIKDEIEAYNPLIPKGSELVFTFMFEIDQKERRDKLLFQLGHVEDTITLCFKNHNIKAISASNDDIDRTTSDGKTSSIHFLKFPFSKSQINDFKDLSQNDSITIHINHQNYLHSVGLNYSLIEQLQKDF